MKKGYVLDGVLHEGDELVIRFDEPFFAHGHGLFETLRTHRGRPCFLRPHVERMRTTARELEMPWTEDEESIRARIAELLERLAIGDARVKLHLLGTRDDGASFLVTAEEIAPIPETFEGIAVGPAAPRFLKRSMAGLKTMNYMLNRLAEREGRARGLDEVLFVQEDGTVAEGTRSTVFLVRDGRLVTPPLDLPILPGVTRRVFLHLAGEAGIPVEERRFGLEELAAADEAFLVASVSTFRPIARVEERRLPAAPGPVGLRLVGLYRELVERSGEIPGP